MKINNCDCNCVNLYILSFNVGGDSGLAIISANKDSDAIQILKNSGKYHGQPLDYVIHNYVRLGEVPDVKPGLLLESYNNALGAYELFENSVKWIKGDVGSPAGFGTIEATVDNTPGTPSVIVTTSGPNTDKNIRFEFSGIKGENGLSAGFGTPEATISNTVGIPTVEVESSGPDTAKVFKFHFANLKGEVGPVGVTSVALVIGNDGGTPTGSISLNDGELTLYLNGIKGLQGNSGYSGAAGELEVVNNLEDGGETSALSAEQGKILKQLIDEKCVFLTEEEFEMLVVRDDTKIYCTYEDEG